MKSPSLVDIFQEDPVVEAATLLLELGARQQTSVPLADLAVPYAAGLCEHLHEP